MGLTWSYGPFVGPNTFWGVSTELQGLVGIVCGLMIMFTPAFIKVGSSRNRSTGFVVIVLSLICALVATNYVAMVGIPLALAGGAIIISQNPAFKRQEGLEKAGS
jgi:hypothetical protein